MPWDREQRPNGDTGIDQGNAAAPGKRSVSEGLVVQRKDAGAAAPPVLASAPAAAAADDPFGVHLPVQRKETTTNVPLTKTQEQAGEQIGQTIQAAFTTPYPEHRNYPEAPTKVEEIENRLRGYGVQRGPTAEEREWLYQASTACGLILHGQDIQERTEAAKPLNPARSNVVAFALSQVGLVEAHTAAPDPDDPSKKVRKGHDHLRQYYVETGRTIDEGVLRDHRIQVGPAGGNRMGSWCQIFAEWAVNHGGGTFQIGGNRVTKPQAGDVAYMKQAEHMAVVIAVEGDEVTTVDGNMPGTSCIMVCKRKLSVWDQGFHDSFPGA